VRSVICRIVGSSKATIKFDDVTATKFLVHPFYSGCTNRPRLKEGNGKKRAAGLPAASVAAAVDFGDEEGDEPPAKRSNNSLIEEAVCDMDALAGDTRANARYMEPQKECVARRETSCVSAKEYGCAVRA
jgi:hypothetical protein